MGDTGLIGIFLTGLFVGGLSCLAVQGGLLAATIAQREQERLTLRLRSGREEKIKGSGNALPILSFLGAKLIAYTILGFLLGWFGSLFQLSFTMQIVMQFAVVVFMIGTALNILHVHPVFRYFVIQPPRFLTRLVRKQSKSGDVFAPALLGAFTVFIPCGATQAMMALAIASGNALSGSVILFAFVLGSSPVFFILGYLATNLGDSLQQKFMKFAAFAIILFAIFNFNNALALAGSSFTLDSMWDRVWCTVSFCNKVLGVTNVQSLPTITNNATITINNDGYSPDSLAVKAGSQVTLKLVNNGAGGCTQALTIPKLNIQKVVPTGKSDTITFTVPNEPGTQFSFMCSMGMYKGVIHVI